MSSLMRVSFGFYEQALHVRFGNFTRFYRYVDDTFSVFNNVNNAVYVIKYTLIIITVQCYMGKGHFYIFWMC